ncbi:MAG: S8 family serine peptidase [Chloroflexi bacterium]|nr:S8 family serine peptidase [Chloroflexota bacterium]
MARHLRSAGLALLLGALPLLVLALPLGRAVGAPVPGLEPAVALTGAPTWHGRGYRGEGQLVAIYDLGFEGYRARLGSTLPPESQVEVRSFRAEGIEPRGETHGTGVAEIVHAVAPAARLLLVNYDPSSPKSINDAYEFIVGRRPSVLQASVFFITLYRGDGTGTENENAAAAEAAGIVWVQSAGNFGLRHWGGSSDGAVTPDGYVRFATAAGGVTTSQTVRLLVNQSYRFLLRWYDWQMRDQSYHLVLEQGGQVLQEATRQRDSRGPLPLEFIEFRPAASGSFSLRVRALLASRPVHLNLFSYDADLSPPEPATSLSNYADSQHVLTVGGVRWDTLQIEAYSSRGPTLDSRVKPDVVGPTCVPVSVVIPPLTDTTFCGTSAAAPFVSGAVALLRQARPELTPAQVRDYLRSQARDLGPVGPESVYGWGLAQLGQPPGGYRLYLPAVLR